jgi:hypothetical protein
LAGRGGGAEEGLYISLDMKGERTVTFERLQRAFVLFDTKDEQLTGKKRPPQVVRK